MGGGEGCSKARETEPGGRRSGKLVKLAVSLAAVWAVVRQIDLAALGAVLAAVPPMAVFVAFVIYLSGQVVTAVRWQLIARKAGFKEMTPSVIRYYFVGMFFNLFGPSTLGGDVVRSLYLAQRDRRRVAALHTVLFDRAVGLAMLVLVAVGALALFGRFAVPEPLVWLTVAVALGILVAWWLLPPLLRSWLPSEHAIRRHLDQELQALWRDRRLLLTVTSISIVFHLLQIGALLLLGGALGLEVPWQYYFLFHPLVTVFSALPISLAGLGIREMGYVYFLADLAAVPREAAFGLALLWLAVLIASSLVGGLVFLLSGAVPPTLRATGASNE